MKTIKDFLQGYADKFPEKINRNFLVETDTLTFDYADGLITFFNHYGNNVTGSGGDNSCDFYDTQEYQYIWAELLQHEPKFMKFMDEHKLDHENLMVLIVRWRDNSEEIGKQEVECDFTFYEMLDED